MQDSHVRKIYKLKNVQPSFIVILGCVVGACFGDADGYSGSGSVQFPRSLQLVGRFLASNIPNHVCPK